jgi:microcystin-dependent protein
MVYQCVAGQTTWMPYSDKNDLVNELELAAAIGEHNESEDAHEDIRAELAAEVQDREEAISAETLAREEADQWLQEQLDGFTPEGQDHLIEAINEILEQLNSRYPIGMIYMSVENVNPATFIGGTWTVWGKGRVPVGVDTSQPEFDTVEKTNGSGAKTHTLSQAEMPSHTHTQNSHTHDTHTGTVNAWFSNFHGVSSGVFSPSGSNMNSGRVAYNSGSDSNAGFNMWATHNSVAPAINNTGGGAAHNNLQPYITCYMWKRTG